MPDEHRGRDLPDHLVRTIRRLRRQGLSLRAIAQAAGVSLWAVQKYIKLPAVFAGETEHGQTQVEPR